MENIDMITRLGYVIEQLNKAGDYAMANELSHVQINLTEERSKGWNEGFNVGFGLANKQNKMSKNAAKSRIR